jgi:hypothetical protein
MGNGPSTPPLLINLPNYFPIALAPTHNFDCIPSSEEYIYLVSTELTSMFVFGDISWTPRAEWFKFGVLESIEITKIGNLRFHITTNKGHIFQVLIANDKSDKYTTFYIHNLHTPESTPPRYTEPHETAPPVETVQIATNKP